MWFSLVFFSWIAHEFLKGYENIATLLAALVTDIFWLFYPKNTWRSRIQIF